MDFISILFILFICLSLYKVIRPYYWNIYNWLKRINSSASTRSNWSSTPIRPLTDEEKAWLSEASSNVDKWQKYGYIPFTLFIIFISLFLFLRTLPESKAILQFQGISLIFIFLMFVATGLCWSEKGKMGEGNYIGDTLERKYKKDLNNPVMKIEGIAFKEYYPAITYKRSLSNFGVLNDRTEHYDLRIRNLRFIYMPDDPFIQSVHDGNTVSIEYSPHSLHVWKNDLISI